MSVVAFDENGARAVVKATREAQRRPRTKVRPPAPPRPLGDLMIGVVSTAVDGATATGPGKGMVQFKPVIYADDDSASYGPLSDPYPLYTFDTDGTAAGVAVLIGVVNGRFHIVTELCSSATAATTTAASASSPSGFQASGFTPAGFEP